MPGQTFWIKPTAVELGTDGGYKFMYNILDEQRNMEGSYEYYTEGKLVNYADPWKTFDNSNWDYTDPTQGTRNRWTSYSHVILGTKFTTTRPTEYNKMGGRASLTIRPLGEMSPPVYNPVPCEFHLLIEGWIHIRVNLELTWVQYGHFEHGNTKMWVDRSNAWYEQNYGTNSDWARRQGGR